MTEDKMKEITEKLESRGLKSMDDLDTDEMLHWVQLEYDFEFMHTFSAVADIFFYEETTADGYSVYIATEDPNRVNIGEDVYYYESDKFDKLIDAMRSGLYIYIDEYEMGEWQIAEAVERLYEEMYNAKLNELINEVGSD